MSIAIITGASSGIGAEFVKQLHEMLGINDFWLVARREEKMQALQVELGINAKIIKADLSAREGIEELRHELETHKPEISYLVNAAGFGDFGAFDELPESTLEAMIDLNVKSVVLITHMVIPYMSEGGRIIQMGSASCFTPLPYFNIYASGKAFILHYTKALNHEIKKYGIKACCFCPGWVETEFLDKALTNGKTTHPKKKKPLLKVEDVVKGCVKASKRGKVMYVTNWYTRLQHLLFKILPDPILTRLWLNLLVHPNENAEK